MDDASQPQVRVCVECGAKFTSKKTWAADDPFQRGRFCTRRCKEKARSKTPEWRADQLRRYYERKYGLTVAEVEAMRARGCDICGATEAAGRWGEKTSLHVDHDHETGRVRGILCHICNVALGGFRDDIELLRNAVAYLARSAT